jgi:hypothetical protein
MALSSSTTFGVGISGAPSKLSSVSDGLATRVPNIADFAGADQFLRRLADLENQNQYFFNEIIRLKQELAEIKDTVDYRTWCAEGMPGLIKPDPNESEGISKPVSFFKPVCACGHLVSLHGPEGCRWRQGPENDDPECSCRNGYGETT